MSKPGVLITIVLLTLCFTAVVAAAPGPESVSAADGGSYDIGIFVPGVVAGSPIYEQLVAGAERAALEAAGNREVTVKVLEGGFNQGEWEEKMMSMAATMEYELILTANGAMPYIALPVAEAFPDQRFLIMDAVFEGHPRMVSVLYNQVEQAALVGYLGGLVTSSGIDGATPELKLGMIVGQEYPAMNEMIVPGFLRGAREVHPGISVDFRVLGNWYDANKAAELAGSMMDSGVDVILTISGGANQGVISAVQDRGRYVLYFDADDYALAPGTIIGCAVVDQERATFEYVSAAIGETLEWGKAHILGAAEGYVDFVDTNPLYADALPASIRATMAEMLASVRGGKVALEVPRYW